MLCFGVISKVILETCLNVTKRSVCCMACAAGVDFVKTSTGFGTGATVADILLMREAVGRRWYQPRWCNMNAAC